MSYAKWRVFKGFQLCCSYEVAPKEDATGRTITVQAFLHQSKDAQGTEIEDNVILEAAKKAFGITK